MPDQNTKQTQLFAQYAGINQTTGKPKTHHEKVDTQNLNRDAARAGDFFQYPHVVTSLTYMTYELGTDGKPVWSSGRMTGGPHFVTPRTRQGDFIDDSPSDPRAIKFY